MQNNASDELILVDEYNQIIGYTDKGTAHYQNLRHRAFSLFLYDESTQRILLHQRALNKYHSGGLWTNSCCSHPRRGEELMVAVVRRAKQELGVDLLKEQLYEVGSFMYFADYGELAEYEIDHVVYTKVQEDIKLNVDESEIMDVKWESISFIEKDIETYPHKYSVWFKPAFTLFLKAIS